MMLSRCRRDHGELDSPSRSQRGASESLWVNLRFSVTVTPRVRSACSGRAYGRVTGHYTREATIRPLRVHYLLGPLAGQLYISICMPWRSPIRVGGPSFTNFAQVPASHGAILNTGELAAELLGSAATFRE